MIWQVCGTAPSSDRLRRLRRSELAALDIAHVRSTPAGFRLLIPRSNADAAGEGAEIGITRGTQVDIFTMRALRAWLQATEIGDGPVFHRVTQWRPSPKHSQLPSGGPGNQRGRAARSSLGSYKLEPERSVTVGNDITRKDCRA
jgi:hypothetical protein